MSDGRRNAARRRALVAAAAATLTLAAVGAWAFEARWGPERVLRALQGTGWAAAGALLLSLCARPAGTLIGRLRRRRVPTVAWRRLSGMTAAALATLHASIAASTYLVNALDHVFAIAWLRAGASALLVLLALWLTSFPRLVRALRIQHWKSLHRLAYVAGLLAFQHALLSPFASRGVVLGVFGVAALLGLARLLPSRAAATRRDDGG